MVAAAKMPHKSILTAPALFSRSTIEEEEKLFWKLVSE